jgi:hypothetical protein
MKNKDGNFLPSFSFQLVLVHQLKRDRSFDVILGVKQHPKCGYQK